MIFDSHAHYDDKQFDEDREEVLLHVKGRRSGAGCQYQQWLGRYAPLVSFSLRNTLLCTERRESIHVRSVI